LGWKKTTNKKFTDLKIFEKFGFIFFAFNLKNEGGFHISKLSICPQNKRVTGRWILKRVHEKCLNLVTTYFKNSKNIF